MRYVNLVMLMVFIFFAFLQWNDPDPWLWVPVYGFAAMVTGLALWGKPTILPLIGTLGYLAGSIYLWPELDESRWIDVEEARESLGLLICSLWSGILSCGWLRTRWAKESD